MLECGWQRQRLQAVVVREYLMVVIFQGWKDPFIPIIILPDAFASSV
jgi:hypothetical protein